MNSRIRLYPTILTPFRADKSIDYDSLGKLIAYFSEQGLDGIFAVCQSSEMFFLDDGEKLQLAEFSIRECRRHGMKCVVSGHTQDDVDAQISYLKRLEHLEPDAIILVNNRLARENEPESVLLENLKKLLAALSPDTRLGVYECPYPCKRLISDELIDAMLADGRFDFIKDTCCKSAMIKHRLGKLSGSGTALYNANAATLYESIRDGAAGYSGIMLNMMPECFVRFADALAAGDTEAAQLLSDYIAITSVIEYQNYPVNAKYILQKKGIFETRITRNPRPELTESQIKEVDAFVAMDKLMQDRPARGR